MSLRPLVVLFACGVQFAPVPLTASGPARLNSGPRAINTVEVPPSLASFPFTPPEAVAFARLWSDVGQFHPFMGSISRQEWVKSYFPLLNRVATKEAGLHEATAEALGALGDPASMVLGPGEGEGACFLPVIYTFKKDGLWIVGGAKTISAPFGPITKINGQPLQAYIAAHAGIAPTNAQAQAVLEVATLTMHPTSFEFVDATGRTLTVETTLQLPSDAWVEGGWNGTPIHLLALAQPSDLEGLKRDALDLRTLPWFPAGSSNLGKLFGPLSTFAATAKRGGAILETKWLHIGFNDGTPNNSPYRASLQSLSVETMDRTKPGTESHDVRVTTDGPLICDPRLLTWLGGWGLPDHFVAAAKTSTYPLSPQARVRLGISYYSDKAPDPSLSEYAGPIEYLEPYRTPSWNLLTVAGAKNLAAATILNWVQHYGFIKTEIQQSAFKEISALPESCDTVHDLLLKASYFLQEPHATSMTLDYRDFGPTDWTEWRASKHSRLPFISTVRPGGELQVLRGAAGTPFKAGALVTAINGQPTKDLIDKMKVRVATPANPFRTGKDLGMLFPYDTPLDITYTNPGEPTKTEKISPVTYDGPWAEEDPEVVQDLAKKGWIYLGGKTHRPKAEEILDGLERGKNFIIDFRFATQPIQDSGPWPRPVTGEYFCRMPEEPVEWGHPGSGPRFFFSNDSEEFAGSGKHFKGKIAILVWGITQSSMETTALLYHNRFLDHAYLVGTPTSGITGAITYMKLPLGGSDRVELFSPTGSWPTFDGASIQYRGLPLDVRFSDSDIQAAIQDGSKDPYITAFERNLSKLR